MYRRASNVCGYCCETVQVAVAASDKFCAVEAPDAPSCDADNRYHSLEWQLYGNTQRCAFNGKGAAVEQLARMQVRCVGGTECGVRRGAGLVHAPRAMVNQAAGGHAIDPAAAMP